METNEQLLSEWIKDEMKTTETFAEKQARIKATAERVNKAIGLKQEDLLFNETQSEQ